MTSFYGARLFQCVGSEGNGREQLCAWREAKKPGLDKREISALDGTEE